MSSFIIFGSGGVGIKVLHKLETEKNRIICFADNDCTKWGTAISGKRVISPEQIADEQFDYVAIGVFKAVESIQSQLNGMGIANEKILIPIEPERIFPNREKTTDEELEILDYSSYLSINTRKYRELNIQIRDMEFLKKLEDLKSVLKRNRIPRNKVCVVSGAVLQAFALRETKTFDDIDIIMTNELREQYGKGLVIVSDTAEMHKQNQYSISDDCIIMDPDNHFVFSNLKFMSPRILAEYVKKNKREEYELLLKLDDPGGWGI